MTFEQMKNLSEEEMSLLHKRLSSIRKKAKTVNFGALYGAGAVKIASSSGMLLDEASLLHTIFWKRNGAVKKVANSAKVKTTQDGKLWLFNPISKLWINLRYEKDKFSSLNQSSAVYCFDSYIRKVREKINSLGLEICGQFHDEWIISLPKHLEDTIKEIAYKSIEEVNAVLKLNVELGISVDFGNSYSQIH